MQVFQLFSCLHLKKLYFCTLKIKFLLLTIKRRKCFKMIIVPVKEGESIDRALKRYKRKYEKTGVVKELRERQKFTKPSVLKRAAHMKAVYVQKLRDAEENI